MKERGDNTVVETDERRSGLRFPLELHVDWRAPRGGTDRAGDATTANISSTGLLLASGAEALGEGSPVELTVRLPLDDTGKMVDIHGVGHVVRVHSRSDRTLGVAIAFDQIEFTAGDWESVT